MPTLPALETLVEAIRQRLYGDPGFVLISGFPVELDQPVLEAAYQFLGEMLGEPVSQNRRGELIGRVEDVGADIEDPTRRGHESSASLPFHCDRADVVELLCVRAAATGGLSLLASSEALYDTLSRERPDLLAVLCFPLPNDRRGEEQPDELPWVNLPVFAESPQGLVTRYVRRFVQDSQRHRSAPRLSEVQIEALDAVDEILARPGLSLEMALAPGDLQIINNCRILHSRTAFSDDGGAGRLLLRLWLAVEQSPELPEGFRSLYGATRAGTFRGGVWPTSGVPPAVGVPVRELARARRDGDRGAERTFA